MNRQKCRSSLQITLDDDFNVPDSKPDIARLLKTDGEIKITDKKPMNGKLLITGTLLYRILYISEDSSRPLHTLQGELPFNESVNLNESCSPDDISVSWEFEDLSSRMINSRKYSLRSLVLLTVLSDELYSHDVAVDLNNDGNTMIRYASLPLTGIAVSRRDSCRIKEVLTIPNAKPAVSEILYYEIRPYNLDIRLMTDKFTLNGELSVFVCYLAEGDAGIPEYYETELPISTVVDCPGCLDNMIPYITILPASRSLEVKPDSDGEERRLELEILLDLVIRLYEEQELQIIDDLYSLKETLIPVFTPVQFETLVQRNNSRTRISEQITIPADYPKILQLCHVSAAVKLDSIQPMDYGLLAEGVVDASIFYISADDARPLEVLTAVLPFSAPIEINGFNPNCIYEVHGVPEQLTAMQIEQDTLEIKAGLSFDSIVFCKQEKPLLSEVSSEPFDLALSSSAPAMTGYSVKPQDTLWDIAKRFSTTAETIQSMNELGDSTPEPGKMLLIVRECPVL